jgi:hypothetical protein
MIRRQQAPIHHCVLQLMKKGGDNDELRACHHLLPFSLVIEYNDEQGAHHLLLVFCPLLAKIDNEPLTRPCFLMFCSLIPKDNDKPVLVIIFFCFVFVHLKEMTMSRCLSSLFFFCFLYVHPEKTTTNMLVITFFVFFLSTQKQ